jgi:dCTP deaminase
VPPKYAAEMVAYDTMVGEFRVHYAGFFDPGFGYSPDGRSKSRAVLEVRSHEVPFMLEHEQIVGWLRYEHLSHLPDKLYGADLGSSYQAQGLALGKQFKQVTDFT